MPNQKMDKVRKEIRKYAPGMPIDGTYDLIMTCCACQGPEENRQFVWKAEDQIYYQGQGYKEPPARCKGCHKKLKEAQRAAHNAARPANTKH